ncbi:MAG: hypothetical protein QXW79_00480 [Thermoplasmata archaeon]
MFFLATNIIIGKYYPNFFVQFVIGCIAYIFVIIIVRDLMIFPTSEKYKYYILVLLLVDVIYLIHRSQNVKSSNKKIDEETKLKSMKNNQNVDSPGSISLSSEMDDIKVVHDIMSSETDPYSLFSTSEKSSNERKNRQKSEISISSVILE